MEIWRSQINRFSFLLKFGNSIQSVKPCSSIASRWLPFIVMLLLSMVNLSPPDELWDPKFKFFLKINIDIYCNHIKARIDKTQQNSKYWLCGDWDETINHIISECSKLAQKEYEARHDWVVKVIHWEMCKKFKFDHTNKWYMHNPAPVLESDTHKLLWDFNIQTDHLIPARRPDLIIINKKREFAKLSTLLSRRTTE